MAQAIIVEDDIMMRELIRAAIEHPDLSIQTFGSGLTALPAIEAQAPDLLVLDANLPDMHGLDILKKIRDEGVNCTVFVITADHGIGNRPEIALADVFLMKPFSVPQLRDLAHRWLFEQPS